MRMIGLVGGRSWGSSAEYYRLLNEGARAPGCDQRWTTPWVSSRVRKTLFS